jgi:hypothetical protein
MPSLELLNQVSTLIAIWVAIYGIDSWRREHRGTRQIELAEETLALFYEAADAIRYIRNPSSTSSETDEIVRAERESEPQFQARKQASIVFRRYQDRQELFNKLHSMRYRFMSQIGKDEARPFDDLWSVVGDIRLAAMMLTRLWAQNYFRTPEQAEKYHEQVSQYEAVFWAGFPQDTIEPRVSALVVAMEITCKGVIAGKGTFFYAMNKRIGSGA